MTPAIDPRLIPVPLPIRTPRLIIRSSEPGDGKTVAAAVTETWHDLHQWMAWAESLDQVTPENQEARIRSVQASFARREEFHLIGFERTTGAPVVWCGFHEIDWDARHCHTGYWTRKSAQNRGYATEATNALLRYAFSALGMRRVDIVHAAGNVASSRVVQKLGFTPLRIEPDGSSLPNGRVADKHCYARYNTLALPLIEVTWGVS